MAFVGNGRGRGMKGVELYARVRFAVQIEGVSQREARGVLGSTRGRWPRCWRAADLITFSTQFGLRQPSFQVGYANGQRPPVNANWNIEEALDMEWAHAMAPGAKVYLVEAASNSFADLLQAVSVANTLLKAAGGGEVSMSWGGSEFAS